MADAVETKVFERRLRSRRWLLGFALLMGALGLALIDFGHGHFTWPCLILSCLCVGLAGFRVVYMLEVTGLRLRLDWLRWPVPKWVGITRKEPLSLGALRCGPSFASPGRWSLHASGLGAMEYVGEAQMQADIDAVRAHCPMVAIVRDDVEVPRRAEPTPMFERCQRIRKDWLQMAAASGVGAIVCAAFTQGFLTATLVAFACFCVFIAAFRVTYTLTGTRLTETLLWHRWPFPTWFRYALPRGTGVLRVVTCRWSSEHHVWHVTLSTSGGSTGPTYRDEALMQADLDELRALCPRVPIVMR